MQLVIKDFVRGIRCDLTGEEIFDKFTYYSISGTKINVDSSRNLIAPGPKSELDLDISETAFDELWEKVRSNLGDQKQDTIKCDLSPQYLSGKFIYWIIDITKVDVEIAEVEDGSDLRAVIADGDTWDIKASDEEITKLLKLKEKFRATPFDESTGPQLKRDVIKIKPNPVELPSAENLEPMQDIECFKKKMLKQTTIDEIFDEEPISRDQGAVLDARDANIPEIPGGPDPISNSIENEDYYKRRALEIIKNSKKRTTPLASPDTPEPEVGFKPEITKKKVKLPETGSRVNIKRRKK